MPAASANATRTARSARIAANVRNAKAVEIASIKIVAATIIASTRNTEEADVARDAKLSPAISVRRTSVQRTMLLVHPQS